MKYSLGTYQVRVATVVVRDGVPDGVQVAGTADVGDPLGVAAAVAGGELLVDAGDSVQRLVDVAHVVNNETEGEGLGLVGIGEVLGDLLVVDGLLVVASATEPGSERVEGLDHVL